MIRIASCNVENLFARPKAFDGSDWTIGELILAAYEEINRLFQKPFYDDADKARITELLVIPDIYSINANGVARRARSSNPRWAWLRKNRGSFDREPRDNTQDVVIIATGHDDWIGSADSCISHRERHLPLIYQCLSPGVQRLSSLRHNLACNLDLRHDGKAYLALCGNNSCT